MILVCYSLCFFRFYVHLNLKKTLLNVAFVMEVAHELCVIVYYCYLELNIT